MSPFVFVTRCQDCPICNLNLCVYPGSSNGSQCDPDVPAYHTSGPIVPHIKVIAVLDLTADSHGNAIRVGHADLIPQRLRDKIDLSATYTNCLTSHNLAGGKIPVTLPTDRDVIEAGLVGTAPERATLCRQQLDKLP